MYIGVALATFMQVLDFSIANVAVPYIAGGLGTSNTDGTWVITMFAVGNAIGLPLTGWLTERFGMVRVFLTSIALFTLLSWICGVSISLDMIVISRFLQGLVAGPIFPLSQSVITIYSPPEKRALGLSVWFGIAVSAPVVGPIIGGWLTYDYSWPWIFFINLPIGAISAFLIWLILHSRETPTQKKSIDWAGLFLLTLAIAPLQILLDKGEQYDWFSSPIIIALGVISLVSLSFLILWELTHKTPLLEFKLLKDRTFLLGTFVSAVSYFAFYGSFVLTPLWLQDTMGYTALWAGLATAPMGLLPIIISPILPIIMKKLELKTITFCSFVLFAIVYFYFSRFTSDISFGVVAISRLYYGLPLAFYFTPLVTLSMQNISDEKTSSAAGIYHFIRIFCGGAGASLLVTLWTRRTALHHSNVGAFVTPYSSNSNQLFSELSQRGIEGKQSLEIVNNMANSQASILGLNDAFWFCAWLFISLLFVVLFASKKRIAAKKAMEG